MEPAGKREIIENSKYRKAIMPTPTTIEITKRLKQKVIRFVKKNKSITNRQCRELLGLGPDQVVHVFKKMVEDGELVQEGKTVSTKYRLPPN